MRKEAQSVLIGLISANKHKIAPFCTNKSRSTQIECISYFLRTSQSKRLSFGLLLSLKHGCCYPFSMFFLVFVNTKPSDFFVGWVEKKLQKRDSIKHKTRKKELSFWPMRSAFEGKWRAAREGLIFLENEQKSITD